MFDVPLKQTYSQGLLFEHESTLGLSPVEDHQKYCGWSESYTSWIKLPMTWDKPPGAGFVTISSVGVSFLFGPPPKKRRVLLAASLSNPPNTGGANSKKRRASPARTFQDPLRLLPPARPIPRHQHGPEAHGAGRLGDFPPPLTTWPVVITKKKRVSPVLGWKRKPLMALVKNRGTPKWGALENGKWILKPAVRWRLFFTHTHMFKHLLLKLPPFGFSFFRGCSCVSNVCPRATFSKDF